MVIKALPQDFFQTYCLCVGALGVPGEAAKCSLLPLHPQSVTARQNTALA